MKVCDVAEDEGRGKEHGDGDYGAQQARGLGISAASLSLAHRDVNWLRRETGYWQESKQTCSDGLTSAASRKATHRKCHMKRGKRYRLQFSSIPDSSAHVGKVERRKEVFIKEDDATTEADLCAQQGLHIPGSPIALRTVSIDRHSYTHE